MVAVVEIIETLEANASGGLEKTATSKESLEVRKEGLRNVTRKFFYYNLDAIISIGYRKFGDGPQKP